MKHDGVDFASAALRRAHCRRHGLGFETDLLYLKAAREFFVNPDTAFYRRPNGDLVKYGWERNEFGVLTRTNTIRTYFRPIRGTAYFLDDVYRWTGLRLES